MLVWHKAIYREGEWTFATDVTYATRRKVQQPSLCALHSGKATRGSLFQSFQLVFGHAFHCERPVDRLGQKWDQETSKKSVGYSASLYLLGFVDWKKCSVFWRESFLYTNVKVQTSLVFCFLVLLIGCKGWKQYVRFHQFTQESISA